MRAWVNEKYKKWWKDIKSCPVAVSAPLSLAQPQKKLAFEDETATAAFRWSMNLVPQFDSLRFGFGVAK